MKPQDQRAVIRHVDEMEWETIRWPGETGKMLFHPRPEAPDEPNAGLLRLEPGAHHPLHRHDFAQIWYVLEGTFDIGGKRCGPGSMLYHADPHYEDELRTETGGPPAPSGPQRMMVSPISDRIGRARSTSASAPPAMISSWPCTACCC